MRMADAVRACATCGHDEGRHKYGAAECGFPGCPCNVYRSARPNASRHMVAVDGDGWRCVDCRIWFPTWPSDLEPCPGKGKFCPRCRAEVVVHPMSEFASDDPEIREWRCGECAGGDAIFLGGMSVHEN